MPHHSLLLFLTKQDKYSSTTEGRALVLWTSAAAGQGQSRTKWKDCSIIGDLSKSPLSFACWWCWTQQQQWALCWSHSCGYVCQICAGAAVLLSHRCHCTSILISLWSMGQPMNNKIAIKLKHALQCDRRKGRQQRSIWESAPPLHRMDQCNCS